MKLYRATFIDENGNTGSSLSMPEKMVFAYLDARQDSIEQSSIVVEYVATVSDSDWEDIQASYMA